MQLKDFNWVYDYLLDITYISNSLTDTKNINLFYNSAGGQELYKDIYCGGLRDELFELLTLLIR